MADAGDESNSTYLKVFLSNVETFLDYAARNPYEFLSYVFIILAPMMLVSAILSYKLAKHLEQKEKEGKKKITKRSNMAKAKRRAKAD